MKTVIRVELSSEIEVLKTDDTKDLLGTTDEAIEKLREIGSISDYIDIPNYRIDIK